MSSNTKQENNFKMEAFYYLIIAVLMAVATAFLLFYSNSIGSGLSAIMILLSGMTAIATLTYLHQFLLLMQSKSQPDFSEKDLQELEENILESIQIRKQLKSKNTEVLSR
ncbi:MAG TPA: hypothetical protein VF648_06420 [Pyrinomonadaceae bacterium]|jgi:ABC-type Fe3+-siderophore transport system permease subunit